MFSRISCPPTAVILESAPMITAMPPHMVPCPFCDRLFTRFSIGVHEPQCADNPYRRIKKFEAARQSVTSVGRPQRLPALKRRSRSVGHSAPKATTTYAEELDQSRPSTRTLDRNAPRTAMSALPETGVCFVCGERYVSEALLDHEVECEALWRTARRQFPSYVRCRSPSKMRIPSVDGTVDAFRMDKYAADSARRCRTARCLKCAQILNFDLVLGHQCARFEPSVQFYF